MLSSIHKSASKVTTCCSTSLQNSELMLNVRESLLDRGCQHAVSRQQRSVSVKVQSVYSGDSSSKSIKKAKLQQEITHCWVIQQPDQGTDSYNPLCRWVPRWLFLCMNHHVHSPLWQSVPWPSLAKSLYTPCTCIPQSQFLYTLGQIKIQSGSWSD